MKIIDIKRRENLESLEAYSNDFKSFCYDSLASLIPQKNRVTFFKKSILGCLNGEGFSIPSPFHRGTISGYNSFRFRGGRNVIILGQGDEVILVVQKYYYMDQLYLVEKNEAILLGDTFEDTLTFFLELKTEYIKLKKSGKFNKGKHKAILNIETNRPFHAMYPILGTLSFIEKNILIKDPIQCFIGKSYFYDYSCIFSWISRLTSQEKNFMVRAEDWMFSKNLDSDRLIIENSINNHHLTSELCNITAPNKYVVWIDLNNEKRKLMNRNELLYQLFDDMIVNFNEKEFVIIFDGLTGQEGQGYPPPIKLIWILLRSCRLKNIRNLGLFFIMLQV